jgi:hypothetical protein
VQPTLLVPDDFAVPVGLRTDLFVIEPGSGHVIGCVYFYPPRRDGYDVDVRSWVRSDRAELDRSLHDVVQRWVAEAWPFQKPDYAER